MSNDPRRPKNQGWRAAGKPADRQRDAAQPQWKKTKTAVVTTGRRSRKTKIGLAFLGLVGFTAALVWTLLYIYPAQPASLLLVGSGYEDNLAVPVNVTGVQGIKAIQELTEKSQNGFLWWGDKHLHLLNGQPTWLKGDGDWAAGLANSREKTVVIFMAMHGMVDGDGRPCLIRDEPGARHLLPVEEVLKKLGAALPGKNKVLILDATQPVSCWPLGMLENDFASGLEQLDDKIRKIPNLVVISASAPGQRSWSAGDGRSTVFTEYVVKGLRGEAGDRGRVNAEKLYEWVRANVAGWARDNRGAAQTPVLLPGGLEGQKRAKEMDLVVVSHAAARPAEQPPTESAKLPPELKTAWEDCFRLRGQTPAPWLDAPHVWHEYVDTLLRYEQLMRAGDPHAAALATVLATLKAALPRRASLQSVIYAPALADATSATTRSKSADAVEDLWKSDPKEWQQKWDSIRKTSGSDSASRVQLSEFLVNKAAEDPANGLHKARLLLDLVDHVSNDRPADAQFMALLDRDLAPGNGKAFLAPPELVALALHTRQLAEAVALAALTEGEAAQASYAEQIRPWIAAQVQAADAKRRQGEDRLFPSMEDEWQKGRADLEAARTGYTEAQRLVVGLRPALSMRDRLFAELPYYSRWVAGRAEASAQQVQETEDLWRSGQRLAELLGKQEASQMSEITHLTNQVQTSFTGLARAFTQTCDNLSRNAPPTQKTWQAIEDALSVPFIDPHVRMTLLERSLEIARKLEEEHRGPSDSELEAESALENQRGRWQGRLALAMLGKSCIDQRNSGVYEEIGKKLNEPPPAIDQAGQRIGDAWWNLTGQVEKLALESRGSNLEQTKNDLARAEPLAELLAGCMVHFEPRTEGENSFVTLNPVAERHRLELEDLLLWQAERTYLDHWFAEKDDPDATPYYEAACHRLLADATELASGGAVALEERTKQARLKNVSDMLAKLARPAKLHFDKHDAQYVTTQTEFNVDYRFRADEPSLPVLATFWLDAKEFAAADPDKQERYHRRVGDDVAATGALQFALKNPRAEQPRKEDITLHGLYRGQRLAQPVTVMLYSRPDVVVRHDVPDGPAAIAARIDESFQSEGALAIVLDYTGSMSEKIDQVTRAVRRVLEKIPSGTRVSVWVFGRKKGDNNVAPSRELTRVERITEPPFRWSGSRAQIDFIMDALTYSSKPMNYSPVVEAMIKASEDLSHAKGAKTLLVLTDGDDNLFEDDNRPESVELHNRYRTKSIPEALKKAFTESGIYINLVMFRTEKDEEQAAWAHFSVIKNELEGTVTKEEEADGVAEVMQQALRPKLRLARDDHRPVKDLPRDGKNASFPEETTDLYWKPPLDAEPIYSASMLPLKRVNIQVQPGDRLELIASSRGGKAHWERGLYGNLFFADKKLPSEHRHALSGDQVWLMSLLENYLQPRTFQLMASLEDAANVVPLDGGLSQRTPKFAYFELDGLDKIPGTLNLRNLPNYPGPSWGLDYDARMEIDPQEVAAGQVRLRAYWSPDRLPESFTSFTRDPGKPLAQDFKNASDQVTLEASVELREVEPGVKESCLVVRARRADHKPVMVRVRNPNLHEENQLFLKAGESTGYFWPMSAARVEKEPFIVDIISLDDFKDAARKHGTYAELPLPPPDRLPRPPAVQFTK